MTTTERFIVAATVAIVILGGSAFIVGYWLPRGLADAAIGRVLLYAVVMTCVSTAGVLAHAKQATAPSVQIFTTDTQFRPAVKSAIIQQAIALFLAALMLDSGQMLRIATFAALAYWLGLGLILWRRAKSPTSVDLLLARYGFWPAMIAAVFVAAALGRTM